MLVTLGYQAANKNSGYETVLPDYPLIFTVCSWQCFHFQISIPSIPRLDIACLLPE
jgi:hypothetical protein